MSSSMDDNRLELSVLGSDKIFLHLHDANIWSKFGRWGINVELTAVFNKID